MKRLFFLLLVFVNFIFCFETVFSQGLNEPIILTVNGVKIDLEKLPAEPFYEEKSLMVPLRLVGEGLGYKVDMDMESGEITIEDSVQKASLYNGSKKADFKGKLKIIDLSREIENSQNTVIINGYTYVPIEFFEEFFNIVAVDENKADISPQVYQID